MCTMKIPLDLLENIKTCSILSIFPCYAARSLGNSMKTAKIITAKLVISFNNKLVGITCYI